MTTVISGSSPSITFSDATTQTTAFTSTPSVTSITTSADATINGLKVGKGYGSLTYNSSFGVNALNSSSLTGNYNTAIGYGVLAVNTSGSVNTALGGTDTAYNTMGANLTGSANSAFGNAALAQNQSGNHNMAIGYQSLYSNVSSSENTAVGFQASYYQTGGYNTAIGSGALFGASGTSSGTNNTALGYQALRATTTGAENMAIGSQALYANTSGGANVAVGLNALVNNQTGSNNVAIGKQALNNTTADNNTAVGYQAGFGNTSDSNNTYIGYTCGSSVTGAGNVMFGASTFSGYSGSNQVACKTGNGREAFYADLGSGTSFRQYSNSSSWATTSDQRVKENIVEITNGLEKIVALRPVEFDYITTKEHNIGFVAQDFKNVLPDQVKLVKARPEEAELVGENEIYTIQQNLTPYLVKAIQELSAKVTALENK
jgi:hypothetical protein